FFSSRRRHTSFSRDWSSDVCSSDLGKRLLTGESLFMTHFSNEGRGPQRVGFAAPYPGTVVPIDLAQVGGRLICQKDAFLCAAYEIGRASCRESVHALLGDRS